MHPDFIEAGPKEIENRPPEWCGLRLYSKRKQSIAAILGYSAEAVTGKKPAIKIRASIYQGFRTTAVEVTVTHPQDGIRTFYWQYSQRDEVWAQNQTLVLSDNPRITLHRSLSANAAHPWTDKSAHVEFIEDCTERKVYVDFDAKNIRASNVKTLIPDRLQAIAVPEPLEELKARNYSSVEMTTWGLQVADIAEIVLEAARVRARPRFTTNAKQQTCEAA